MAQILAGDIGGTKTILQCVEQVGAGAQLLWEQTYRSADFGGLVPMIDQFLAQGSITSAIDAACFAIAGPVQNDTCTLTNLNWILNARQLETALNIPKIHLINDFAAIGYGIFGLQSSDLYPLQKKPRHPHAPLAIVGAGTGLGQGFVIPQGKHYQVFSCEGGHTDFAPRNEQEFQLLRYIEQKYQIDRVSVERVVSGQGIKTLYQFLQNQGEIPESPEIAQQIAQGEQDQAAIIAQAALEGRDRLCEETLKLFISAYGAEVGNVALKFLPYGGLYIAGGIAAKILPLLEQGDFLAAYRRKGRMQPLLEQIPIDIILNPQVGLIGARLCAAGLLE